MIDELDVYKLEKREDIIKKINQLVVENNRLTDRVKRLEDLEDIKTPY